MAATMGCDLTPTDRDTGGENLPAGQGLPWRSISPGGGHACGVRSDGRAYCWGEGSDTADAWPTDPVLDTIPERSDLVDVHVSDGGLWEGQIACARTTDGAALCWGHSVDDPFRGPYTSIAVGDPKLLGLRTEGRLECLRPRSGEPCTDYSPLDDVRSFVADPWHLLAVHTNGELSFVQIGNTDQYPTLQPGPWSQIALPGSDEWICGIREGGELSCFGGEGNGGGIAEPPKGTYTDICVSGGDGACALDQAGLVSCWGETGTSSVEQGPFVELTCGYNTWCGVTADGDARCWGACYLGVCDLPP